MTPHKVSLDTGILDAVRKHGFAGNVSIECVTDWQTNLAGIAQCVGYMRVDAKLRV